MNGANDNARGHSVQSALSELVKMITATVPAVRHGISLSILPARSDGRKLKMRRAAPVGRSSRM
jgi:hypothetical protein